jgi:AcrR family transcriptional regulator
MITRARSKRESARRTAKPGSARSTSIRRRRSAVQSHGALIAATQSLMARGEPITTVSVTAEAGLAQPTFYAYFGSVEQCRLAAVENAIARLTEFDSERRSQVQLAAMNLEAQERAMVRWLEGARERGAIHSIYDRYRDESSEVGELLRAMSEAHLARLTEDLFGVAARRGIGPEHYRELRLLALTLTASVAAVARAVHRGQVTELERAARLLVRNGFASVAATLAACGASPDA